MKTYSNQQRTGTDTNKIRSLSNGEGDVNENGKKAKDFFNIATTLHVHHACLYIFLPLLHDYDVIIKAGSHMPPMHLRHERRYYLGYGSDMRTEVAGNIAHPSLYPRHGCDVD